MKKTFLLLIILFLAVFGTKAQETMIWEHTPAIDTMHHSVALMYCPQLGFEYNVFGIRYGYRFGNRWEATGLLGAVRDDRAVPGEWERSIWDENGQLEYSGPGLDYKWGLDIAIKGGIQLHMLKFQDIRKWDPYVGLEVGTLIYTYSKDYYYSPSGPIDYYKMPLFSGLSVQLNVGAAYSFTDHWTALAELSIGNTLNTVRDVVTDAGAYFKYISLFGANFGVSYRF